MRLKSEFGNSASNLNQIEILQNGNGEKHGEYRRKERGKLFDFQSAFGWNTR